MFCLSRSYPRFASTTTTTTSIVLPLQHPAGETISAELSLFCLNANKDRTRPAQLTSGGGKIFRGPRHFLMTFFSRKISIFCAKIFYDLCLACFFGFSQIDFPYLYYIKCRI